MKKKEVMCVFFSLIFLMSLISFSGIVSAQDYQITISSDENNVNLYDKVIATGWDGSSSVNVLLIVNSGVLIGSSSATSPALEIGNFPVESQIKIINNGQIIGAGGKGGGGAIGPLYSCGGNYGNDGQDGGTAIKTSFPIIIDNKGTIAGGGGGGGGSGSYGIDSYDDWCQSGGGGGGGQGFVGGTRGTASSEKYPAQPGTSGSLNSPGIGGNPSACYNYDHQDGSGTSVSAKGGDGGELGQPGERGRKEYHENYVGNKCSDQVWIDSKLTPTSSGGEAGKYLEGVNCVTFISQGTILGITSDVEGCVAPSPLSTTHLCSSPSQIIMKLFSSENSHGALWNDANYNYEICYDEIFGTNYTGANPHNCTTGNANRVLWLYNNTNSHASTSQSPEYNLPVCYGDLVCTTRTDPETCTADERIVVRLYQETNSHISNASDTNYPKKICCKSGIEVGDIYWANMLGVRLPSDVHGAQIGDTVKLVWTDTGLPEGTEVVFDIDESDCLGTICTYDSIRVGIRGSVNSEGNAIAKWTITQDDYESGDNLLEGNEEEFIFTVPDYDKTSDNLIVGEDSYDNAMPSAIIIKPVLDQKNRTLSTIYYGAVLEDEDDDLSVEWKFGDGNSTSFTNCLTTGNCDTTHSYSSWGTKIIILTATEQARQTAQKAEDYTRVFIYDEGINVFAVIDRPPFGQIFGSGYKLVEFDASESYVATCATDDCTFPSTPAGGTALTSSDCYSVGTPGINELKCFDYPKDWIGIDAGQYNLWFNWTFSDTAKRYGNWTNNHDYVVVFKKPFYHPTKHWANLRAGYDDLS